MSLSIIRITYSQLNESEQILTLKADIISGKPSNEHLIFLRESTLAKPYNILKANDLGENKIELLIEFSQNIKSWDSFYSRHLDYDENIIFCGIDSNQFKSKKRLEQKQYILDLVELLSIGKINQVINESINYQYGFAKEPNDNFKIKLGGIPTPLIEYPTSDNPIVFLTHININELGKSFNFEYDVKGHLFFFGEYIYDEDVENYELLDVKIKYFETLPDEVRSLSKKLQLEEVYLYPTELISIPDYETVFRRGEGNMEGRTRYKYIASIIEYYNKLCTDIDFLGHPKPLQDCVLREAEMFTLDEQNNSLSFEEAYNEADKNKEDWMLLLQIDLIDDFYNEIIDFEEEVYNGSNMLYVLIRKEDFKHLNFDNIKTIIQFT